MIPSTSGETWIALLKMCSHKTPSHGKIHKKRDPIELRNTTFCIGLTDIHINIWRALRSKEIYITYPKISRLNWLRNAYFCISISQENTGWGVCVCLCLVTQSCLTLCNLMDCSLSGSSVHGIFLGKNIGVDCHFPPPGDISYSGTEPGSPVSPALWTYSLPTEPSITPKFPDSIDHRMLISALTSLKRTKVRKC